MGGELMLSDQGGAVAVVIPETNEQMVKRVEGRVQTVQHIYRKIMVKDSDFGVIPGCGDKPALLKAGAEKLLMAFKVSPSLKIEQKELGNGHREIIITCTLTASDGTILGEGVGSCSTLEKKYRYRKSATQFTVLDDEIPQDYKEKKTAYREKGFGCKQVNGVWKWVRYEAGESDQIENPDIADQYNTVLKIAKKRALIDAVLTVFGASDIFTQDIDENAPETTPQKPQAETRPEKPQPPAGEAPSYKDTILAYKKRATAKGAKESAELEKVIDTYLADVAGKDFQDISEDEAKDLCETINAHYVAKKEKK